LPLAGGVQLADTMKPSPIATWAKQAGWSVPRHFDLIVEIATPVPATAAMATKGPDGVRRAAAVSRENQTLLKLVIGMAIQGYKYDPIAKRSDIPNEIARDLQALGLKIDDDTVRKWLRLAADTHLLNRSPS